MLIIDAITRSAHHEPAQLVVSRSWPAYGAMREYS
jgi:hypothetical protein